MKACENKCLYFLPFECFRNQKIQICDQKLTERTLTFNLNYIRCLNRIENSFWNFKCFKSLLPFKHSVKSSLLYVFSQEMANLLYSLNLKFCICLQLIVIFFLYGFMQMLLASSNVGFIVFLVSIRIPNDLRNDQLNCFNWKLRNG